jgi:hypothetical protein
MRLAQALSSEQNRAQTGSQVSRLFSRYFSAHLMIIGWVGNSRHRRASAFSWSSRASLRVSGFFGASGCAMAVASAAALGGGCVCAAAGDSVTATATDAMAKAFKFISVFLSPEKRAMKRHRRGRKVANGKSRERN